MSLHFSRNLFFGAALSTSLLFVLASCQDEEFGFKTDQIKYESNFKKSFGSIPADQSWDLSSYADWNDPLELYPNGATRSTNSIVELREGTHFARQTQYSWEVPSQLRTWMQNRLKEGNDNRYLGSSFMLKMPTSDFAIIPVFQGNSAITSNLELKINGYEIKEIWKKSQDMKSTINGVEREVGFYGGWANYDQFEPEPSEKGNKYPAYTKNPASTIKATSVKTTPIVFDESAIRNGVSGDIYMYLSLKNVGKQWNGVREQASYTKPDGTTGYYDKKDDDGNYIYDFTTDKDGNTVYLNGKCWDDETNGTNTWTNIGDRLTSIHPDGYMLALDIDESIKNSVRSVLPDISGVDKTKCEMIVVGCEDANLSSTDHDINDIVFLIVGFPDVPDIVPTTEYVKKRYMCEDLGGSEDFDFNDIVVDVTQKTKYDVVCEPSMNSDGWDKFFNTKKNPSTTPSVEISGLSTTSFTRTQTAKISHVCGTLPIQAQVGNYLFPWITDPTNLKKTRTELCAKGWVFNGTSWVEEPKESNQKPTTRAAEYPVLDNGWNPNEEKVVTGWNPTVNNIKIYVQWPNDWKVKPANGTIPVEVTGQDKDGNNYDQLNAVSNPYKNGVTINNEDFKDFTGSQIYAVTFPENGKVPYIIATNQDVKWMEECKTIDMAWLRDAENHIKSSVGEGSVGSSAYYEYPDANKPEVVIWQGSFTGEIWNHALSFPVNSAEHNGILEATGTEDYEAQCNTLNIYFDKKATDAWPADAERKITLCNGNWQKLTTTSGGDTQADYYHVLKNDQQTISIDGTSVICYRIQIKLTSEQLSDIRSNGLLLQIAGENVCYRKVSFTKESGFSVSLAYPTDKDGILVGKITTTNGQNRWRDSSNETDAAKKMSVPFTHAEFVSGTTVSFEASGIGDYVFEKWIKADGSTYSQNRKIDIKDTNVSLEAIFKYAEPTTLEFEPGKGYKNEVTLYVGEKYAYEIKSTNQKAVDFKDVDTDNLEVTADYKYFRITPKSIGNYKFKVYQSEDGVHAASNEIEITVHAVEKPDASVDLSTTMYHVWAAADCQSTIATSAPNGIQLKKDENTSVVYGESNGNVSYLYYADLSSADVMIATVDYDATVQPRFLFNRKTDAGTLLTVSETDTKYLKAVVNSNAGPENAGSKIYVIDLAAIRKDEGFVHLDAIKGINAGNTHVTDIKLDYYYCAAENALPRTLWEGSVNTPIDTWGQTETINIPASFFAANDTYHSTKLRIYLNKQNSGAGWAVCPIAGRWGAATPVEVDNYYLNNESYIDVNMDYQFFADLKYNQKLLFNGNNVEVTKVELIENTESNRYNLILDKVNSCWNNCTFTRSPLKIEFPNDDTNKGCGWDEIDQTIISQYNTVKVVVQNVTDLNGKKVDSNNTDLSSVSIDLTTLYNDGSNHYLGDTKTYNGNPITLSYTYGNNPIKQIFLKSRNCKVQVKEVYLTNE